MQHAARSPTRSRPATACLAVALSLCAASAFAACRIESPAHRLTLLELYTSEGCNSCPPADSWLSGLRGRGVEQRIVPLAFHVDYWNYLGWEDRFSQPAFSARQHEVAQRNRSRVVYTPQVVLDGRDWLGWRDASEFTSRLGSVNAQAPGATIRATATLGANAIVIAGSVGLGDKAAARGAQTWVAVYEHGLASAVAAGENRGRRLAHDYVVRALFGPIKAATDGAARLDIRIPLGEAWNAQQLGVAVFAEDADTGRVLQAAAVDGCLLRRDAAQPAPSGLLILSGL